MFKNLNLFAKLAEKVGKMLRPGRAFWDRPKEATVKRGFRKSPRWKKKLTKGHAASRRKKSKATKRARRVNRLQKAGKLHRV